MPITDAHLALLIPLVLSVLAIPFLWLGMRAERRYRLVHDMPTCRTSGVFIGLVELEGRADILHPLASYLCERSCVWYSWSVEERWSRWETETYRDSKGRTRTRRVHKSGWRTVADGGEYHSFLLVDDHGQVLVNPHDAKIEPQTFMELTCGENDPLYYAKGPREAIRDSDYRRRFTETGIAQDAAIYVMGQSRVQNDSTTVEIAADAHAPMFLISTRNQRDVANSYRRASLAWLISGGVVIVGLSFFITNARNSGPINENLFADERVHIAMWSAGAYLGACLIGWIWMVYNSLTELRHRVLQAWANIEVELKRRAELIPNLIRIVEALTAHEQDVQTMVTTLRSQMHVTKPGQAGSDPNACSLSLRMLAEAYPELQAQSQFSDLHHSLTNTEDRIALARAYFNDMATHLNTRLEIFPDRFVAMLTRIARQPLMHDDGFSRNAPQVTL